MNISNITLNAMHPMSPALQNNLFLLSFFMGQGVVVKPLWSCDVEFCF